MLTKYIEQEQCNGSHATELPVRSKDLRANVKGDTSNCHKHVHKMTQGGDAMAKETFREELGNTNSTKGLRNKNSRRSSSR